MSKKKIKWTDAHRREALRRTYEIAADMAGKDLDDHGMAEAAWGDADSEAEWRNGLDDALDPARIDREVQRVHALATGRLVRETVTEMGVRRVGKDAERMGEWVAARLHPENFRIVVRHVTRIRRSA